MLAGRCFLAERQRDILLFCLFLGRVGTAVGIIAHGIGGGSVGRMEIAHLEAPGAVSRLRAVQVDPHGIVVDGHRSSCHEFAHIGRGLILAAVGDNEGIRLRNGIRHGKLAQRVKGQCDGSCAGRSILPELIYRSGIVMLRFQPSHVRYHNRVVCHRDRAGGGRRLTVGVLDLNGSAFAPVVIHHRGRDSRNTMGGLCLHLSVNHHRHGFIIAAPLHREVLVVRGVNGRGQLHGIQRFHRQFRGAQRHGSGRYRPLFACPQYSSGRRVCVRGAEICAHQSRTVDVLQRICEILRLCQFVALFRRRGFRHLKSPARISVVIADQPDPKPVAGNRQSLTRKVRDVVSGVGDLFVVSELQHQEVAETE